jgi:hypothetical protein
MELQKNAIPLRVGKCADFRDAVDERNCAEKIYCEFP